MSQILDKMAGLLGYEPSMKTKKPSLLEEKSSRAFDIGEEFNYAMAAELLGGSGIPHPKRGLTLEHYARTYGRSVWVYSCVYLIATSIASAPLRLYRKPRSKDGRAEMIDDPTNPLVKLLSKPNPYMGGYELMENLVSNMELTGNAYLEEVSVKKNSLNGGNHPPTELYSLQSHRVKIVPGARNSGEMIGGYIYEAGGSRVMFKPHEITHIKYHNPVSDFYGASPLMAAELAISGEEAASRWNTNFFKNSARPDVTLETDQQLNEGILKRMRRQWQSIYGGTGRSHQVAILEGGLKARILNLSQKDMDFINLRRLNREEILSVYGVPPALIGSIDSANKSNMEEQRRIFWEHTLLAKLEKIQASITSNIVQPYDDDLYVAFDKDSIEALKESRETRARVAAMLTDRGIMTINEIRERFFNLSPVEWGDRWNMPLNLIPVDQVGTGMGTEEAGGVPGRERGRPPVELENLGMEEERAAFKGIQPFPPINPRSPEQRSLRKLAFVTAHKKLEDEYVKKLNDLFHGQALKVLDAVRKGVVNPEELDAILDGSKEDFVKAAQEMYEKIVRVAGNGAMKEVVEIAKPIQ